MATDDGGRRGGGSDDGRADADSPTPGFPHPHPEGSAGPHSYTPFPNPDPGSSRVPQDELTAALENDARGCGGVVEERAMLACLAMVPAPGEIAAAARAVVSGVVVMRPASR